MRHGDDAASTLKRQMYNHSLAQDNVHDFIAICTAVILKEMTSRAYQETYLTTEQALSTLVEVSSPGLYACGSRTPSGIAPEKPFATLFALAPKHEDELEVVELLNRSESCS